MKDNLEIINFMDKEHWLLINLNIKENGKMDLNLAKENIINSKINKLMSDNGKMIKNMAKEKLLMKIKRLLKKEHGIITNLLIE